MEMDVSHDLKAGPCRVAIIGGGISGLVTAYRLRQQAGSEKLHITLYEASPRLGGVIETLRWQDCLIESGPDSFITNKPFLLELAKDLNLSDRIVKVQSEGGGALIYSGGRMHAVPDGFVMLAPSKLLPFAASGILSPAGKVRALMELVVPQRKAETSPGADESLADFVRRRFGAEVLDKLAQPMVAGIYVGDAEKLSAQSVASRFLEMEQTKGSVIRALMKNREKSSGARYGLFASFDGGIGTLVEALLANLPDVDLRSACAVGSIDGIAGGYRVTSRAGESADYHRLVMACPAASASSLLTRVNPSLASRLGKIQSASSVVVNFVFEKEALASLEKRFGRTFGAVIPLKERKAADLTLIAFSFASNKYPLRAPDKEIIVRAFLGGVGEEKTLALGDDDLLRLAEDDLSRLLSPTKPAHYRRVHRWPDSMPQYNLGHEALVAEIEAAVAGQPGLYLTGASYRGVGIPDCVNSANLCAKKLMADLA